MSETSELEQRGRALYDYGKTILYASRVDARFPFCSGDGRCVSLEGAPRRSLADLSFTAPVTAWGRNEQGFNFAVLAPLSSDAQRVTLTTPLLPTGTATASVIVPAVE